jgi:AMP deaminase
LNSPDEHQHGDNANGQLGESNHAEGATPQDEHDDEEGLLPRDKQRRTAYYDYTAEKQMSHQEAKQFYQKHKLDSDESYSPLLRAKTMPSTHGLESDMLSRGDSIRSRQSNRSAAINRTNYQSALPVGMGSLDGRSHDPASHGLDTPKGGDWKIEENDLIRADLLAREHANHPAVPHEPKPLLATEGLHGAGAGIGVGTGAGGFAADDAHVTAELSSIYTNVQKILDLRHKYIRLSLQGSFDNPKDDPGWQIYPHPPDPAWDHNKGTEAPNSAVLEKVGSLDTLPKRPRKPGQDIGEDFNMDDLLPLPGAAEMTFEMDSNGVYQVYETSEAAEQGTPIVTIPTIREFYMDLEAILDVSSDGPSKSFAFRRLQYLEGKFNLYILLNEYQETADSKKVPHRDFYNVRKVDTHVHHSACMNQKHLLRFIKSKMKKSPDEVVLYRDGRHLTLKEVFESINLTAYDLSIDTLDMHVSSNRVPLYAVMLKDSRHTQTASIASTSSISNITQSASHDFEQSFSKQTISFTVGIWPSSQKKSCQISKPASTRWWNGAYPYTAAKWPNGTKLRHGWSTISFTRRTCDGLYRFLDSLMSINPQD